jgi:hypothetical protein
VDVIENGQRRSSLATRITVTAAVVAAVCTLAAIRLHGSNHHSSTAAQASPVPSSSPTDGDTFVSADDNPLVLLHFSDEFTNFDHGTFMVEFKLFNDNGHGVSMTASQMRPIPGIKDSVVRVLPLSDWGRPEAGLLESPPVPAPIDPGQAAVYAIAGHVSCGHTPTRSGDYPAQLIVDGTVLSMPLPTLFGRSWESAVKRSACN